MQERIELSCRTNRGVGVSSAATYIATAKAQGMTALAITDFTSVQAFPAAADCARKENFRILYGVQLRRHAPLLVQYGASTIVTILARNREGVKALYELLSEMLLQENGKATLCEETLRAKRQDWLLGSAGGVALLLEGWCADVTPEEIRAFAAQFDYLTVTPSDKPETVRQLLSLGQELDIPVVAVSRATYATEEDGTVCEILGRPKQPFLSTAAMLDAFAYLPREEAEALVIGNTHRIAHRIEANIEPVSRPVTYPEEKDCVEKLTEQVYARLRERYGENPPAAVTARVEQELTYLRLPLNALSFYMAEQLCAFAHEMGYPTGIRGCAGASFIAYLLGISEIDPLAYGLHPETFFGFDGDQAVDIDINFPSEIQQEVLNRFKRLFGGDTVVQAGTVGSPPYHQIRERVTDYLHETRDTWDETDVERLADQVLKAHITHHVGQHPGGWFVIPRDRTVYEFTPLKKSRSVVSTHMDFHDLLPLGLLKADILSHSMLSLLKALADKTGVALSAIPLEDEQVLALFRRGDTLGGERVRHSLCARTTGGLSAGELCRFGQHQWPVPWHRRVDGEWRTSAEKRHLYPAGAHSHAGGRDGHVAGPRC